MKWLILIMLGVTMLSLVSAADTAISACGGTLSTTNGRYYLSKNINTTTATSGGYCLRITANNVSLNLNGYNMSYVGASSNPGSYGISITSDYAKIYNGSIIKFYTALRGNGADYININTLNVYKMGYVGMWFQPGIRNNLTNVKFYNGNNVNNNGLIINGGYYILKDIYIENYTNGVYNYGAGNTSYTNLQIINSSKAIYNQINTINLTFENVYIRNTDYGVYDASYYTTISNNKYNNFKIENVLTTFYSTNVGKNNLSYFNVTDSQNGIIFTYNSTDNVIENLNTDSSYRDISVITGETGDCSGDPPTTCEQITTPICGSLGCNQLDCGGYADCTVYMGDMASCSSDAFCYPDYCSNYDFTDQYTCEEGSGPSGYCYWNEGEGLCEGEGWCWGDGNCADFFWGEDCANHYGIGCYEDFQCWGDYYSEITCPEITTKEDCFGVNSCDWNYLFLPSSLKIFSSNFSKIYIDNRSTATVKTQSIVGNDLRMEGIGMLILEAYLKFNKPSASIYQQAGFILLKLANIGSYIR